jgi:hypothetical protein
MTASRNKILLSLAILALGKQEIDQPTEEDEPERSADEWLLRADELVR